MTIYEVQPPRIGQSATPTQENGPPPTLSAQCHQSDPPSVGSSRFSISLSSPHSSVRHPNRNRSRSYSIRY